MAGRCHIESVLVVAGPQDELSKGVGRGRPNTRSTREGDRSEITVFPRCRPYRTVFSGDSAIPESRATGATISQITRDCNRPVDVGRGFPTVQSAKRGPQPRCGKRGSRGNLDASGQWYYTTKPIRTLAKILPMSNAASSRPDVGDVLFASCASCAC